MNLGKLTDIELLDRYCETCLGFIDPIVFREIQKRGLGSYTNMLPYNIEEAKSIVRAKYAQSGKYIGDPEIEQISQIIENIKRLRKDLMAISPTNVDEQIPVLKRLIEESQFVQDYFKTAKIPM